MRRTSPISIFIRSRSRYLSWALVILWVSVLSQPGFAGDPATSEMLSRLRANFRAIESLSASYSLSLDFSFPEGLSSAIPDFPTGRYITLLSGGNYRISQSGSPDSVTLLDHEAAFNGASLQLLNRSESRLTIFRKTRDNRQMMGFIENPLYAPLDFLIFQGGAYGGFIVHPHHVHDDALWDRIVGMAVMQESSPGDHGRVLLIPGGVIPTSQYHVERQPYRYEVHFAVGAEQASARPDFLPTRIDRVGEINGLFNTTRFTYEAIEAASGNTIYLPSSVQTTNIDASGRTVSIISSTLATATIGEPISPEAFTIDPSEARIVVDADSSTELKAERVLPRQASDIK